MPIDIIKLRRLFFRKEQEMVKPVPHHPATPHFAKAPRPKGGESDPRFMTDDERKDALWEDVQKHLSLKEFILLADRYGSLKGSVSERERCRILFGMDDDDYERLIERPRRERESAQAIEKSRATVNFHNFSKEGKPKGLIEQAVEGMRNKEVKPDQFVSGGGFLVNVGECVSAAPPNDSAEAQRDRLLTAFNSLVITHHVGAIKVWGNDHKQVTLVDFLAQNGNRSKIPGYSAIEHLETKNA